MLASFAAHCTHRISLKIMAVISFQTSSQSSSRPQWREHVRMSQFERVLDRSRKRSQSIQTLVEESLPDWCEYSFSSFQDITMSDTGSAKAGCNRILDSLVLPGNTNDPSDYEKDFFCKIRDRPCTWCLV